MRGIFTDPCASAEDKVISKIVASSQSAILVFMFFLLLTPHTSCLLPSSFNHPIRPREKFRRKCQPDLLRCLQVDEEFKLCRLLHRKIGRFGAL